MYKPLLVALCAASLLLAAEAPNLAGVWKLDPAKSKMAGPPAPPTLMLITQDGPKLTELVSQTRPNRPEYRQTLTYTVGSQPVRNLVRLTPMRTKTSVEGNTLVADWTGPSGYTKHETFTLSPDGNTLTITSHMKSGERETDETQVFEKQPDSAGDALRQPEKTAAEAYKNVQLLKNLSASRFIDTMQSFNASLGVRCDFCHVEGNFAADEKQQKAMARNMIKMASTINEQSFNGRQEIRCYTCHQGHEEPRSFPQ